MAIHLEQLAHQQTAISRVLEAMKDCIDTSTTNPDANYVYANPVMKRANGIDVKMETGTGKTYVYTRLMHELYRDHGINKFIIMTPSLAIKEGTKNFISSEYATQHFRELFPTQKINLGVVNAGDFTTKKGKRKQFAGALTEYCEASRNDVGTVNVLLLNDAMLASKSMTRDDYDQTLIGSSSCPVEALKLTRPVVIIDEPHRFKKDGTAWENIQKLNPQLIIRFGATFPEKTIGSGRNKIVKKDYDNLVYDLNAVQSFNQGLVKAIDINYPNLPETQAQLKYHVVSATNRELVLKRENRQWTVQVGEDLSVVDTLFEGDTTYEGKKLSNELEIAQGMVLVPGVWANSYQEMILRQAIDAHFEKERSLFHRHSNAPRVKTISLYFIDSILSYREKDGWLKTTFEKLLNEKLSDLIEKEHGEYKEFLEATKASLNSENQKVHAGYFAEDSLKKGDDAIQDEVDDILRNKEQMLKFKDEDGNWNTRRFLFSKWTLREGWDNPNIFVLTKLRSSGSETSKIQEVGRGLRLPVDELGNRLSDEEFRLHFLIDFTERDFAQKLLAEVNADGGILVAGKITEDALQQLVDSGYAESTAKAKGMLLINDIIDSSDTVIKPEELDKLLPIGVHRGKIRSNESKKPVVHLRKDNWEKIRELWDETSKRFMLKYNALSDEEVSSLIDAILANDIFRESRGSVVQMSTEYDPGTDTIKLVEKMIPVNQDFGQMKYGDFIKRLNKTTSLPINSLHKGLVKALEGVANPAKKFNENTLNNIIQAFNVKFIEIYAQKYEYDSLDFTANVSVFDARGMVNDELDQGLVGVSLANDVSVQDKYLYEEAAFDSDIEHEILKVDTPDEVLVFGKLPRRSIKVPTFTGGTTSPDFVYAFREGTSDAIKIHALIEAKGKDGTALTSEEKVALDAQAKISSMLKNVDIKMVTKASEIDEILRSYI